MNYVLNYLDWFAHKEIYGWGQQYKLPFLLTSRDISLEKRLFWSYLLILN